MLRKTRPTYWSHGPIAKLTAKWLGAPKRPTAATFEEWEAFDKNQTTNFNLQDKVENTLGILQDIWMFPQDIWYTIKCYFNNRFITATHKLRTDLEVGKWHEYETRLLHGMFTSFIEFVEKEQTIENLKWAMNLTETCPWLPEDEAKKEPAYGQPTHQAVKARETFELYTWWKNRNNRPDPYEASGYKAWSEKDKKETGRKFSSNGDLAKTWREMREAYEKEDEEMMIRLVRLRRSLWT